MPPLRLLRRVIAVRLRLLHLRQELCLFVGRLCTLQASVLKPQITINSSGGIVQKQRKKTAAGAPAAPASSSTTRGGRQYKFGPSSLKPLEKLSYKRSDEENQKTSEGQVNDLFQSVKASKHPAPGEKIDPVKAKRTLDALTRAPPPPPQSNYDRIIERTYMEAEWSGSTCTYQRIAEQRRGKQILQLGEQAKQLCPPLNVSSDIVANLPGMLPGTNPGDYMPDDALFDTMEVDTLKYQHGNPLVKPGTPLTTMMRRFHDWYMDICRKSGTDTLTLRVKEEHDLVGIDLLYVPYEEFF
ncbi:uncharacterized protein [Triticum aestivum]|uniref:uncharacterized protein n=1 Tax=Triticum aestivum TaxID=4565 RepID=UPI001D00803F|nr:uncharacterized protein LOC123079900 [Triticum aestivum]